MMRTVRLPETRWRARAIRSSSLCYTPVLMPTSYHAAYWAALLLLKGEAGSLGAITRSLGSARVDLNPHQIDAALFAVRSPFTKGVLLADEVGLGKTIEAGIVLTQRWAERKRRVLLIAPATLRKQWQSELAEKFALPAVVLDGVAVRRWGGAGNPLNQPVQAASARGDAGEGRDEAIVIISYPFAARYAELVRRVPWDLVVADEAHRLRNVYKTVSKRAAAIKAATAHAPKLLLTATPLQNSLAELYGLISVLDEHAFGDLASFREQFVRASDVGERDRALRARLAPYVARTLRRQVLEYVSFTQRIPLTQAFRPYPEEQALYDAVTAYMNGAVLHAIPSAQRALITLVLRKLLASSTFAVAHTLGKLADRALERSVAPGLLDAASEADALALADDFEPLAEMAEEWEDEAGEPLPMRTPEEEAALLRRLARQAHAVERNAKGEALVRALPQALARAEELGAQRKAVVFTESRRTQAYLRSLLEANGYAGEIVCINGTNTDPDARARYAAWKDRYAGTGRPSGVRAADMKAALVDAFRDDATILLATESAAEGVNLQFCSLVVNYDLPWNPQRVEQRIGRCHRYGQQHDVVVVNFLNEGNAADLRVFELLSQKFALFEGVFGASDEVLGALESGVDLERRIARVYAEARTDGEIRSAFDALRDELDEHIAARMSATRTALLDHFDQEVHQRLRIHHDQAQAALDERARALLRLTRHELGAAARFAEATATFRYPHGQPQEAAYALDWQRAEATGMHFYHSEHPLAQRLVQQVRARPLPPAHLRLDLSGHPTRIAALGALAGRSGALACTRLRVSAKAEDEFLLLTACTDDGAPLDAERCAALLDLGASAEPLARALPEQLDALTQSALRERLAHVDARNARFYDEEAAKLDQWADDLKIGLEAELKDLDRTIREAQAAARAAVMLDDKLAAQKHVRALERSRSKKRHALYDAYDDVDLRRDALIDSLGAASQSTHQAETVFEVRWTLA